MKEANCLGEIEAMCPLEDKSEGFEDQGLANLHSNSKSANGQNAYANPTSPTRHRPIPCRCHTSSWWKPVDADCSAWPPAAPLPTVLVVPSGNIPKLAIFNRLNQPYSAVMVNWANCWWQPPRLAPFPPSHSAGHFGACQCPCGRWVEVTVGRAVKSRHCLRLAVFDA